MKKIKSKIPVNERIKTFEDAMKELGWDHPYVRYYRYLSTMFSDINYLRLKPISKTSDVTAYLKLRIITTALNEGWEPNFGKDEKRYFPWFEVYSKEEVEEMDEEERSRVVGRAHSYAYAGGGLAYANAYNASSNSHTNIGSRLAFKSEELAVYCGRQFIDLWADFIYR